MLFRILKNAFINGYRHAKVGPKEVDPRSRRGRGARGRRDARAASEPGPEDELVASTMDGPVAAVLAALPEDSPVVELVDLQDFSYARSPTFSRSARDRDVALYRGRRLLESALPRAIWPPANYLGEGEPSDAEAGRGP